MQAIILAAGMGKRLKELTQDRTKCMVQVNGVALIDRMLHQIERRHLSRIVIVVGYEGEKLMEYIDTLGIRTPIVYVHNPIYDKTNNIYSLALAKDYLCQDDTLLFESDLIFEDSVIDQLLDDPRETLALVDKYESWMDGTCVKLGADDSIASFVPGKSFKFQEAGEYYKTVNIYKFGRHFSQTHYVPFLEAYSKALGNNEYYEQVLRVITMLDDPEIRAKRLNGQLWYEIDDIQDLDIASSMFAQDPDFKVSLMQGRYGGYWRYPQLLDFCYLVNPYFPPQRLIDELQANFTPLLTQYPSGMRVNALLAGKNFAVHQDNIVVGNGAAELIKALMARLEGVTGFIRPTFEEYPNRCQDRPNVCFTPAGPDFRYTADDLMAFFGGQAIDNLVLINPDNPSGNYIPAGDVRRRQDADHAGQGLGLLRMDGQHPCTGVLAADGAAVEHPVQIDVIRVLAGAGDLFLHVYPVDPAAYLPVHRCLRQLALPEAFCRQQDPVDDLHIAGAAADVVADSKGRLLPAGIRVRVQQRLGGDHHAGDAEAALNGPRLAKGPCVDLLFPIGKTLHRDDGLSLQFIRLGDTGLGGLTVNEHCAGAAGALAASVLHRGQAQLVSQEPQQLLIFLSGYRFAVYRKNSHVGFPLPKVNLLFLEFII